MDVVSLGIRTDLALLRAAGSVIEDRGDHLVVRSPHNPNHYWGNFVVVQAPPNEWTPDRWLDVFARALPAARHVALGFDTVEASVDQLDAYARRGFEVEAQVVLTASSVHAPPRPESSCAYRLLASDDDWEQSVRLQLDTGDGLDPAQQQAFVRQRVADRRAAVDRGEGGWFGAFTPDGQLMAQLGVFAASPGLGRYQSVETHPDHRGRGIAGTLVHRAGQWALDTLDVRTLVIVAVETYHAIRVYRSVGFADAQTVVQAERLPTS